MLTRIGRTGRLAYLIPLTAIAIVAVASLSGHYSPATAAEAPTIEEFTASMQATPGYFNTYRTPEGRLFLELGPSHIGKDFLVIVQMARGNGESLFLAGFPLGDAMMTFRMRNNRIELVDRNPLFRATPGTPAGEMVNLGFRESVRQSFGAVAKNPSEGRYLVEVTDLFVDDWPHLADFLPAQYGIPFRLDPSRSTLVSVKGFPRNVEIEVDLSFAALAGFIPSVTAPDPKTLALSYHYSIMALPEEPMKARIADDRVGYFTTTYKDYDDGAPPSNAIRLANRWRLEKRDPYATLSEPVKPIVFYLEKTIPAEFRPYIKQAVEAWNAAFEQAGFKNAILALDQPDDPNWEPGDARYSTIRWVPSLDAVFAIGPSDVDPRSGEILNADILVVSDWVPSLSGERSFLDNGLAALNTKQAKLLELARQINPLFADRLCEYEETMGAQFELVRQTLMTDGLVADGGEVPVEYVGGALREIIMHEVGHTLGLSHNFKASTATPQDQLHNMDFTRQFGVSASVMDYNPPNISMDRSQQGEYYNSVVGTYDRWAIQWGYMPVGDETLEPHQVLSALAGQNTLQHTFASDEDAGLGPFAMDPYVNQYDMGDTLTYYQNLGALVDSLWEGIEERILNNGDEYYPLRNAVHYLLFQRMRVYPAIAKALGGVDVSRVHKGNTQGITPYLPLPASKQREALRLVLQAFRPEILGNFPLELVNKMPTERRADWASSWQFGSRFTYPLVEYVTAVRTQVLNVAFNPERLMRIRDQAFASSELDPFTLDELFSGFTSAIFSDVLAGQAPTNALQREIENEYLNLLIRLGSNEAGVAGHADQKLAVGLDLPASHLPPDISTLPPNVTDVHALAFAELTRLHEAFAALLTQGVSDKLAYAFLLEAQNRIEGALDQD